MRKGRREMVGEQLGKIVIYKELGSKQGNRRYVFKCTICGEKKVVNHSQYNTGNWNVCEHDAL